MFVVFGLVESFAMNEPEKENSDGLYLKKLAFLADVI